MGHYIAYAWRPSNEVFQKFDDMVDREGKMKAKEMPRVDLHTVINIIICIFVDTYVEWLNKVTFFK